MIVRVTGGQKLNYKNMNDISDLKFGQADISFVSSRANVGINAYNSD